MSNHEEMFKVSLVIPVYNVKRFLPQLFSNINEQLYKDFEVLFIDNGSTDGSSDLLDRACAQNNKFKVIHQKNSGTGYSRNVGISQSKGKYIFFMDPDDTIDKRLLLDNVKLLEDNKADIVVFGFNTVNDQGKILDSKRYRPEQNKFSGHSIGQYFEELYDQLVFHALWHKLIRRKFIVDHQVKSPLWPNSQDRGLLMKLALSNPNFVFNCNDIAYYNYISMRTGASTAKFKENLTDIGFQLASCVEDVINKYNVARTRRLMYEVYIRDIYIYTGVKNSLRKNGPNGFYQKIKYINKIYNNEMFINNAFSGKSEVSNLSLKKQLITFLVKYKITAPILFFIFIRNKFASFPK